MRETSAGHYEGYYTATSNVKAPGAVVEVIAKDDYGNETHERAAGKLYINAKK
jgi:bacillopeptidase F